MCAADCRAALLASILGCFVVDAIAQPVQVEQVEQAEQIEQAEQAWDWRLPPGFPLPRVPADNPMTREKVRLGCKLFFDARLSIDKSLSCATCHRPALAFTDGRTRAIGATGHVLRRNAMSLTNVAYNAAYTWASRETRTLESQMTTPLFGVHPVEMGLRMDDQDLLDALASDDALARGFRESFPDDAAPVSMGNLIKAIAAFERTLISGRSAFDRYVFDDERDALSSAARHGMNLFFSARIGCANCHSGINLSGTIAYRGNDAPDAVFANTGLYNIDRLGAYPESDQGVIEESRKPGDMGRFRVPTLRNVAKTAPYMHDGSIDTLEAAIDHYIVGGRANGLTHSQIDSHIHPLDIDAQEKESLIAFLNSLTDERFIGADWAACRY